MTLLFIRIFFLVLSAAVGFLVGNVYDREMLGVLIGIGSGGMLILLETMMRQVSVRGLSSVVFGLLFGIIMAKLISDILALLPFGETFHASIRVVLSLFF
jgi:uncharacterized protein YacL